MFVRELRQQKRFSQEQLAELSGLSLRTIQRVESGHRVSYASLRALAGAFDINVDKLELELYAMDKTGREYRELPLWVRLILGRAGLSSNRRELHTAEVILAILGIGLGVLWLGNLIWPLVYDPENGILYTSLVMFFFAYMVSICIRVGDKFAAWPTLGQTQLRKLFGLAGKN